MHVLIENFLYILLFDSAIVQVLNEVKSVPTKILFIVRDLDGKSGELSESHDHLVPAAN